MNGSPVYVGGRGASRAKNENLIPVPIGDGKTLMVPSDDPSIQPIIQKLRESCMNIMSKKWPFLIFSALHAGNDPFLSTWRFSRGKDKEYIPSSDNYTQVHILKLLLFLPIDYAFIFFAKWNDRPSKKIEVWNLKEHSKYWQFFLNNAFHYCGYLVTYRTDIQWCILVHAATMYIPIIGTWCRRISLWAFHNWPSNLYFFIPSDQ